MSKQTKPSPQGARRRSQAATVVLTILLQAAAVLAASVAVARMDVDPDPDTEGGAPGPEFPPYVFPAEGYSWTAQDRYNMWESAWHELGAAGKTWPSETYDPEYVQPTTWHLDFMGCQNENDYGYDLRPNAKGDDGKPLFTKPTLGYQWRWNGKSTSFSHDCYTSLDFPEQGSYFVELRVKHEDGSIDSWTQAVKVQDYLIVVLGDSSASGEGAVDRRLYPSIPLEQNADWVDDRCHRSKNAGGAQAAQLLELADPKTSVTFLSFACSGATLNTLRYNYIGALDILDPYSATLGTERGVGITGPFSGMEPPAPGKGPYQVPSQVLQLADALRNGHGDQPRRTLDALIVAGGINDARFADLVGVCVLYNLCHLTNVGPDNRKLSDQFDFDVERVTPGWEKLGDELDAFGIEVAPGGKLALEYPGFFENDNGLRCPELFTDITSLGSWDFDEIGVAEAVWAPALNSAVEEGAANAGFEFVTGINDGFKRHGMCASDRYINTATDSFASQGDEIGSLDGSISDTTGVAHPNAKGYAVYADRILDHLSPLLTNEPPVAYDDEPQVAFRFGGSFNVLANDIDPDGDPLSARLLDAPTHGSVKVEKDGTATYYPSAGYLGSDTFTYEVTDGEFTVQGTVDLTVEAPTVASTQVPYGVSTTVGGLLGSFDLDPPYLVVFDKPLNPKRGSIAQVPGEDAIEYTAPDKRASRKLKLRYTVYSEAPPPSTDAGATVRGILRIRVVK